ncbi:MAG: 4Fe-4S binding protein [Syntrophaceae bacterium]
MDQPDVYRELSKKLMMENSVVLPKIWKVVCSEEEARIVNSLPDTIAGLAAVFDRDFEEMRRIIGGLYHRGVVFDYEKDGTTLYRLARHVVQFHDSTIAWEEAPAELLALWEEFGESDYPELLALVTAAKLPAFMRVIPVGETIEAKNQVLAFEDAALLLRNARSLAVTACVCRKLLKRCDGPLDVCLQLDRGADYHIKRGTGRKIEYEEALEILKRSEEAGLVHLTENTPGRSNVLCNCCSCCCEMLRFATDTKTKGVLAPSRFQARVKAAECTSCALCTDICPVGAISLCEDEPAGVNQDECIGCGLCATACPVGAISLIEVRPPA